MQLTTVRLIITLALSLLVAPLAAVAQSAGCAQDFPTEASLLAARTAVAAGGTDVALSPGGCLRYKRSFSGSKRTKVPKVSQDFLYYQLYQQVMRLVTPGFRRVSIEI
jgi:hypothetical protein